MPVRKVGSGYRWGTTGKIYSTRAAAEKQGRAVTMAMKKKKKKGSRGGRRG
jgi:hypothetical protein